MINSNTIASTLKRSWEGLSKVTIAISSNKSIEDIVSVLSAVITRLETNPEFIKKTKSHTEISEIKLEWPEKITIKWLRDHVPVHYWWSFVLLLIFIFGLGLKFADTKLYKSLTEPQTANDNTIKKTAEPNK